MKNFGKILLASTAAIALCGAAHAADVSAVPVYTKAPPLAPAPLVSCTSAVQFIVTDCPLTYYGITVYGTVDVGGGWESHGTPFNKDIISGVTELVQKGTFRDGDATSVIEMAKDEPEQENTLITETLIRHFWRGYSKLMGMTPSEVAR